MGRYTGQECNQSVLYLDRQRTKGASRFVLESNTSAIRRILDVHCFTVIPGLVAICDMGKLH